MLTGYCQYPVSTGKEAFVCHGNKMIVPCFSRQLSSWNEKHFDPGVNIDSLFSLFEKINLVCIICTQVRYGQLRASQAT